MRHYRDQISLLCLLLVLCACGGRDAALPESTATRAPGQVALPPTTTSAPTITLTPTPSPTPTITPSPTATLPPTERLEAAKEAEQVGNWALAFPLYESLRQHPDYGAEALLHLGDLYLREDRAVEAALAWQEGLTLDPDGSVAPFLRYRLARGLAALGRHEQAIELYRAVEAASEGADDFLIQQIAGEYEALGQQAEAMQEWQRLYELERAPRVPRALAAKRVADWHAAQAGWDEALVWYERTMALSEVHEFRAELRFKMGQAEAGRGNEAQARAHWESLLRDYADTPHALAAAQALAERGSALSAYEMGQLYIENERWSEAARAFFTSLEEEADRPEAHQQAALALEQAQNYAAALKEWRKLIETHPEAVSLQDDALLGVARSQAALGEVAEALATWAQLSAQFPQSELAPEALWRRAEALHARGELAEAATAYEHLAMHYPESPYSVDALWEAGMLRYQAGQSEAAQANFVLMSRRAPTDTLPRALFWAGKSAQRLGDSAQAQALWQQAARQPWVDYYTLRARAQVEGLAWSPRNQAPIQQPATNELAWLYEAAQLPRDASLLAFPDDPLLQRGATLLQLGERGEATSTFRELIRAHREEPQALWAIAHALRALDAPSMSIVAALTLMEELGYSVLDVPPALGVLAYPLYHESALVQASAQHDIDPLLFAALIHQESTWEPRARSHAAARGLTQVIPDTGNWIAMRLQDPDYRYRDLDRPLVAFRYGSYYLSYVLGLFEDEPLHALAAYNAGPGNARRWRDDDPDLFAERITLREPRRYIERVYEHWVAYQRLYR